MWMVRIWHPGPTGPDSALAGAAHRTCKWKPAWHEWTNMARDWQICNIAVMMSTSHFHALNLHTWTMYACVYLHLAPKLHMKVDRRTNLASSSPNLWDQWNKRVTKRHKSSSDFCWIFWSSPKKQTLFSFLIWASQLLIPSNKPSLFWNWLGRN